MADLDEQEFIQGCLTHKLYPDRPWPVPAGDLDWARVYEQLVRHELTRLFYRLGREQGTPWPPPLQAKLRSDYQAARLWGEQGRGEVSAVLEAFRGRGIPALVLKGWALIPRLYGDDPGLRLCNDLDLLVQPRDAQRAEGALVGLGYSARPEPWPGFARRYGNCRVWRRQREPWPFQEPFAVGLHWRLLDIPYWYEKIDSGGLFERSVPLPFGGTSACALADEDHLVYACAHRALHHEHDEALFHDFELAALIRRAGPALDWAAAAARAAEWHLVLPLQQGMRRLRTLWPALLPEPAWVRISALRPRRSERRVHDWVLRAHRNHTARALLTWATMPGRGQRWRYLLEHAFPGPDYLRRRYGPGPGGLWPLHYLRRIALAGRYAALALGGACDGPLRPWGLPAGQAV